MSQRGTNGGPRLPSGVGAGRLSSGAIVLFELEDLEFDLAEMEPPDWDVMAARIRWHLSTPYAFALKSIFGEALISGLCLGMAHSSSGWIGDRLMHPRFRGEALEEELVRAAMGQLEAMGCKTVSVMVAPEQRSFFENLGFAAVGAYTTYSGGRCEKPDMDEVQLFEPQHSMGVLHLDKLASGEDRRTLLSEHFYASRVFVSKSRILGYYVPLLGEGLIIADRPLAGLELLRWHLGHVTQITVPEANKQAVEFLVERNYTPTERVLRMQCGVPLPWRPEMLYAWVGRGLG